jgi:hypothetical protein
MEEMNALGGRPIIETLIDLFLTIFQQKLSRIALYNRFLIVLTENLRNILIIRPYGY